jgi:hypothetical protein
VNPVNLLTAEAVTVLEPNGIEPKLRLSVVAFNMDMWWLVSIAGIEEKL